MFKKLIDISQLLQEGMPVYPGDSPYQIHCTSSMADGALCNTADFTMSMHCGTHVDAPLHFLQDGAAIADLALERFCGKAKVVELDVRKAVAVNDLAGLGIENGDRVLIKIPANEAHANPMDDIGLSVAAAWYLVEKEVALLGINGCSVDNGAANQFPVHQQLLAAGIPILENLRLAEVAAGEYQLFCFPLKLAGGNGAPVRAVLTVVGK